jgi:metal-responsive CopG/Arc/MetJ family transcriptional regulator
LEEFDEAVKGRYSTRTDALLDAMRDLVEKLGGA